MTGEHGGGDELAGRAVDAVEDAVLRRRCQHFALHRVAVDLRRAILGDDDAFGDRQHEPARTRSETMLEVCTASR